MSCGKRRLAGARSESKQTAVSSDVDGAKIVRDAGIRSNKALEKEFEILRYEMTGLEGLTRASQSVNQPARQISMISPISIRTSSECPPKIFAVSSS